MADKRTIASKIEQLENQCGKNTLIVALCDCSQEPRLYEIPSEGCRKLNEAEFQEWRKKLRPDTELWVVEIWLNRPPEECASEFKGKKEDS